MQEKKLYFVACLVGEPFCSQIRSLQEMMCEKFGVCNNLNSPPHITLIPPFSCSMTREEEISQIVKSVAIDNLTASANNMNHFDDRVIFVDVVSNESLEVLRNDLAKKLRANQYAFKMRRRFHPHITLGSRKVKGIFYEAWEYFRKIEIDGQIDLSVPKLLRHNGRQWEVI